MLEVLLENPILKGVSKETLEHYFESLGETKYFYKDDVAYDKVSERKSMMFLLKGNARVDQVSESGHTFLKRLNPGDSFGVLSIFSDVDYYPTRVTFEKKSKVLVLDEDAVIKLLHLDSQLLKNYLTFFNRQVQYLLDRIALFSLPNGDDKVMTYIMKNQKNQLLELPMSKVELAEYLGMARSTLYRVFDKLVDQEKIELQGNIIRIIGGMK